MFTIHELIAKIIVKASQLPKAEKGITSGGTISGTYIQIKGPKHKPKVPR